MAASDEASLSGFSKVQDGEQRVITKELLDANFGFHYLPVKAVGSVSFTVNGSLINTENVAPYAFRGNGEKDFEPAALGSGTHVIEIRAYESASAQGEMLEELRMSLTLPAVASPSPTPTPTPTPTPGPIPDNPDNLFSNFQGVIKNKCASCHGDPNSNFGGLSNFYNKNSIDQWKESSAIVPGDAAKSPLYYRLTAATDVSPPAGSIQNMPINKSFSSNEAKIIADFINSLSENNQAECSDTQAEKLDTRRLNKQELNYALQDLFGIKGDFTSQMPRDGDYDGFPKIGDRLEVGELFFLEYQKAVESAVSNFMSNASAQAAILSCRTLDTNCLNQIFRSFLNRAYRREVTSSDLARVSELVATLQSQGGFSYNETMAAAFESILLSPDFVYFTIGNTTQERKLSAYELAQRLSLFIWSSLPDRTLLDLAKSNQLLDDKVLAAQAERMLADTKSQRFLRDFANQWLRLDRLDASTPSPSIYGLGRSDFEKIKPMLKEETLLTYSYMFKQKRPIGEILKADYSFLNQSLSSHYNINSPSANDSQYSKVQLPTASKRQGIFTQGSFLAGNSNSERTSIVLRGVTILGGVLCEDPPAPGDDIAQAIARQLSSDAPHSELMLDRANNRSCVGCHSTIDPIGLAFEEFDAVGRLRSADEKGRGLELSSNIYDKDFNGSSELMNILLQKNTLKACVTTKLATYGAGLALHPKESRNHQCITQKIAAQSSDNLHDIVKQIVLSDTFARTR